MSIQGGNVAMIASRSFTGSTQLRLPAMGHLLRFGIDSCRRFVGKRRGRVFGGIFEFRPDFAPVIRSKVTPGHTSRTQTLNSNTALHRNTSGLPVSQGGHSNTQALSKRTPTAKSSRDNI